MYPARFGLRQSTAKNSKAAPCGSPLAAAPEVPIQPAPTDAVAKSRGSIQGDGLLREVSRTRRGADTHEGESGGGWAEMLLRWESRCSPGCRPARPAGIELAASLANAQTYLPPPPAAGFL